MHSNLKEYRYFPWVVPIIIEGANKFLSYYWEGETLELICKFRYEIEDVINMSWRLPNGEFAQNVCLIFNSYILNPSSNTKEFKIMVDLIEYFRIILTSKLYLQLFKRLKNINLSISQSGIWLFKIWVHLIWVQDDMSVMFRERIQVYIISLLENG